MKINQLKAGAILSYISIGIKYTILLFFTPIMLRLLGQSEYGLYNLVSSVISYLGLLNFGLASAYVRYFSLYKTKNDESDIAKLNGMYLAVFIIIGVVALIAGIILILNINKVLGDKITTNEVHKAKILMLIMTLNLAISLPFSVFSSYITANERFVFQKTVELFKLIVDPFVILPVLLMGYGSIGMVIATSILHIIASIINMVFCFKSLKMKFTFSNFNLLLLKDIGIFSSYLFLNMIIDQINWNVDKFIIGRYKGTIAVAIYSLAAQINTCYISFSVAVSNVFIPRVNRIVTERNDNNELTYLFTKVGRIQFLILALILTGFIFWGKPFIYLWAGPNYMEAYTIGLLLIIPVTIPLFQNIGIEIQKAKNMHQFRSLVYFFIAIANIIVSIPLTKLYGGVGAALGTGISLLLGNVMVMNWYYYYRVGLNMKYFWHQIVKLGPALLLPMVAGLLFRSLVNLFDLVTFIVSGLIYVAFYFISVWFFGLNEYEKELFKRPMVKFVGNIKKRYG